MKPALVIVCCIAAAALALASASPGCNPLAGLFAPPCPASFKACPPGCIPDNASCCPDGSYCLSPTLCKEDGDHYTCEPAAPQNHTCASGQRHCGLGCVPSDRDCCHLDECTPPFGDQDSTGYCPTDNGLSFCGYCVDHDSHGDCAGRCRYCLGNALCQGDVCGALECCEDGVCRPQTDCSGASDETDTDPGCGGGSSHSCGDVTCGGGELCVSTRSCVINEVGEGCECSGSDEGSCFDPGRAGVEITSCGSCSAEYNACCPGDSCVNGRCQATCP